MQKENIKKILNLNELNCFITSKIYKEAEEPLVFISCWFEYKKSRI
jgi:hypothetical protein